MPLLVDGLCPQLTSDIVNRCKSNGILTITNFVSVDTEELSKKTKIPFKDLICIRHALLTNFAAFPQRADSLYSSLLETIYIISSGSKRIDSYLKGGIYTSEVTEIHGPPGSGKTQFCLSVAASLVLASENTALFLDSNNNFVAGRLGEILSVKCEDKQMIARKMKQINVINVRDIYNLFDILNWIKCRLLKKDNDFYSRLKLIIIDSVTCVLSPCFGGKYLDGAGFMSNLAHDFKMISSENISILVTNNTVQSGDYDIKAGLGPSWKYVPSVSLCIRKMSESKLRKMTTVKSCRNGLHKEIAFSINEAGVTD